MKLKKKTQTLNANGKKTWKYEGRNNSRFKRQNTKKNLKKLKIQPYKFQKSKRKHKPQKDWEKKKNLSRYCCTDRRRKHKTSKLENEGKAAKEGWKTQ